MKSGLRAVRSPAIPEKFTPLGLAKYDAMCTAIQECSRVDEAKDIRDRAKALEVYAREAMNFEAERKAAEIRIRAERRAGELLKLAKDAGQRRAKGQSHVAARDMSPAKLSEIGISRDQSSTWQKLAEVPKAEFEAAIASPSKPSTQSILLATGKIPQPKIHCDVGALTAYGHIREFEELMVRPASELFKLMQDFQQEHLVVLLPKVIRWLREMT